MRQSSERKSCGTGWGWFSGGNGSLRKHKRGWEDPSVVGLDGAVAKSTSKRGSDGKTTIMSRGVGVT
jgi:hypothetical protein